MVLAQNDPRLNPDNRFVTVADGLTLPRDVAARYRCWSLISPRTAGVESSTAARYFRVFDDHLQAEVFVRVTPAASLPAGKRMVAQSQHDDTTYSRGVDPIDVVDDRLDRQRVKLLQQLKHPRVVPFHQGIATSKWLVSVSPLLTGGTLLDALRRCARNRPLTERDVAIVVQSVVQGIEHVHNEGLVYGSLHPLTLLYPTHDGSGHAGGLSAVKLSSFRGAFSIPDGPTTMRGFRTMSDVEVEGWWHGSLPFLAPEAVARIYGGDAAFSVHRRPTSWKAQITAREDSTISAPSDMWGVGVLAYLLLTGMFPLEGRDSFSTLQKIHQLGFPREAALRTEPFTWPPTSLTPEALAACTSSAERTYKEVLLARGSAYAPALAFIEACCRYVPGDRLTATEALRHPWLTEGADEQQERTLPPAAQVVFDDPRVTSSAPQPLGRYRQWLHAYVACATATGTKCNSGVLSKLCDPGPWAARTHIVVDVRDASCGSLGCACVLRSLLDVLLADAARRTTSGSPSSVPFPYRLAALDMRWCDLDDESVSCMVDMMVEHRALVAASWHTWRLDGNPRITHQGARHLLRMLATAPEQAVTGSCLHVVSLHESHVGAHLLRRLQALLDARRLRHGEEAVRSAHPQLLA